MPALSPTMETGSISNWLLKEGDAFEAGQAICEVETDKATVTYDATEDGYIAKILVGRGDITVGAPLMITVDNAADVVHFANYSLTSSASPAPLPPAPSSSTSSSAPTNVEVAAPPQQQQQPPHPSGRIVASPFARLLARQAGADLGSLSALGGASGPGGRVVAADVLRALDLRQKLPPAPVSVSAPSSPSPSKLSSPVPPPSPRGDVYAAFQESGAQSSSVASALGLLSARAKQEVPHYYLSVEVDVSRILALRDALGEKSSSISVQDVLVKAAAKAMEKVPAVNAAWMDSFVRQYDQVDINLVVGEGASLQAPLLRNVGARGLASISQQIKAAHDQLEGAQAGRTQLEAGTFTIHNLGMYGVKAAAAIVLPPQACALSLGAVVDTVVPNTARGAGEEAWKVAPIVVCTLSCDHRVVDGAVGAGWLKAFKEFAENPLTLLL